MAEPVHILAIDDSEDDRLLYRRALQKSAQTRYSIAEADNGEDGLRRIGENPPQCILLDYSLPGRNGIEILKHIREQHPFIPVIMLTGQGNENVAVAAMQEGAQNYIAKSAITAEALEHVIRMAIEHCILQKRIDEQRASLEIFTRALAHDLKEPVRTIRSFVELLDQQENFSPKARSYFTHIQNAAERMHMLIDTVFLYTRLDDPGQMAKETCDINTVLQEVKENLDRLIHEHKAVITADALPPVQANRTQMIQLLQNLVANAITHSGQPVAIHVAAAMQDGHWRLRVSDNGPGINAAHLHKIFEPFKRLARHEEHGAGLGLAICRKIVESHGGKIWCESSPGQGASFFFTLPKALPAAEAISVKPAAIDPGAPVHPPNGKPLANVLLVDDSRADIEMTRFRLLERSHLHCNLLVARGGEEALDMLRAAAADNTPIDLLLLDINMPEMDGFELFETMRRDKTLQHTAVVMCTGSIYDKDMARAKAMGAVGYLTKPIEFVQLKSVIDVTPAFRLCADGNGYKLMRAA